jgi:hypothetical protein
LIFACSGFLSRLKIYNVFQFCVCTIAYSFLYSAPNQIESANMLHLPVRSTDHRRTLHDVVRPRTLWPRRPWKAHAKHSIRAIVCICRRRRADDADGLGAEFCSVEHANCAVILGQLVSVARVLGRHGIRMFVRSARSWPRRISRRRFLQMASLLLGTTALDMRGGGSKSLGLGSSIGCS